MSGRIYVEGELFLAVETVAHLYRVETVWLRDVIDAGLLGETDADRIAAVRLDRVATIVRLHRVLGLDVDAIRLALD